MVKFKWQNFIQQNFIGEMRVAKTFFKTAKIFPTKNSSSLLKVVRSYELLLAITKDLFHKEGTQIELSI